MKQLIFAVIVTLLLIATAQADLSVEDYPKAKGKETTTIYIGGIGQGIAQANADLEANNRPRLYCAPGHLAIHAEQYVSILEIEIAKNRTVYNKIPQASVAMALFNGLQRTFPCQEGEQRK